MLQRWVRRLGCTRIPLTLASNTKHGHAGTLWEHHTLPEGVGSCCLGLQEASRLRLQALLGLLKRLLLLARHKLRGSLWLKERRERPMACLLWLQLLLGHLGSKGVRRGGLLEGCLLGHEESGGLRGNLLLLHEGLSCGHLPLNEGVRGSLLLMEIGHAWAKSLVQSNSIEHSFVAACLLVEGLNMVGCSSSMAEKKSTMSCFAPSDLTGIEADAAVTFEVDWVGRGGGLEDDEAA